MSKAMRVRSVLSGLALLVAAARVASAQDSAAPTQPEPQQPAGQPQPPDAESRAPITARVIEVINDAEHATSTKGPWTACKVDDEYGEGAFVRTGVRSSLKLQIGEDDTYTAIAIKPASKVRLAELFRTATTKNTRLELDFGEFAAGVAEGALKSEFTADTAQVTLSKKGTWNFGMFYERGTDRFEVFLLDRGLVEALNRVRGETRSVLPRERVTQAMRMFLDQAQVDNNVAVADVLGQSDITVAYNRLQNEGLGVTYPGQGRSVLIDLSNQSAQASFAELARRTLVPGGPTVAIATPRREGFFGSGRGEELLPVVLDATSDIVKQGFARPGTYNIRRDALEGWLKGYEARR